MMFFSSTREDRLPLLRRESKLRVVNPPAQPLQVRTADHSCVVLGRAIGRGENVLGITPVCVEALAVDTDMPGLTHGPAADDRARVLQSAYEAKVSGAEHEHVTPCF